ncbi:hypothetical protein [Rhodoligotrophos defluvii]|uniref:hypothetical protein n=1 Tax=Rhodoligotrophos defluvii TaxID=2561934 RepID=UPI0010C9D1E1|nr:hypothetical protein [Rhodoligotrophos defluvii]
MSSFTAFMKQHKWHSLVLTTGDHEIDFAYRPEALEENMEGEIRFAVQVQSFTETLHLDPEALTRSSAHTFNLGIHSEIRGNCSQKYQSDRFAFLDYGTWKSNATCIKPRETDIKGFASRQHRDDPTWIDPDQAADKIRSSIEDYLQSVSGLGYRVFELRLKPEPGSTWEMIDASAADDWISRSMSDQQLDVTLRAIHSRRYEGTNQPVASTFTLEFSDDTDGILQMNIYSYHVE